MFQILSFTKDNIVAIRAKDKVTKDDYEKIDPLLTKTVKDHDKINLYLEIMDIKGVTPKAMWEDFKAYFNYVNRIKKIAVVGEDNWTRALTVTIRPWMKGEVRYFTANESLEAKRWIDS
jgi:hypothetical protein